ncbi:MAG TPA: TolC family protein, partial [Treponemataceae bacterium]|nr:TolC family protein [Treponemataceae bacterium]
MVFFSNSKKSVSFLALCFSMVYVFTEPLSIRLDDAVRLAFQNNVHLSSMAIDLRMKKAEKDYAWNVFLPNVQATGTMARSNLKEVSTMVPFPPFTETIVLEEKDKWKVMGGLNISLNLNAALFEGLRATRQSYEAGLLSYEAARRDTEQNVKKAFYGLLLQEGSLAISKEKLASAQKRKTQMEANFKNGLVSELQYLQVQLALETQKPAIMEAELLLAQQKELFAFLLGLPLGTEIVLVG